MFRGDINRYDPEYSISELSFPPDLYTKLFELTKSLKGFEILSNQERKKIENKLYKGMKYHRKI